MSRKKESCWGDENCPEEEQEETDETENDPDDEGETPEEMMLAMFGDQESVDAFWDGWNPD